jgi:cobalt-zinc-cadmium efflux system membrane fusion protein
MKRIVLAAALAQGMACGRHDLPGGHGHDHGDDHGGHDHGAHAESEEDVEPIAITRWTDSYELFVELPPPKPGKPVPYHAHVTRLSDFGAVTEGTFRVRFKSGESVAAEGTQQGVKRPGIFVFESPAPAAGEYAFEMSYEHEGKVDVFDCGAITVSDKAPAAEEESGSPITFLKESQWKIPFGTAWALEQPLARELEVPATVEPAASDQLTIGATTSGRFLHAPKLGLAEGLQVKKGDIIGSIAPSVAGEDFSRLQLAVDESRLAKDQAQREIERIEPLVKQGLLPERRLVELRNQLANESAKLSSASGRVSRVVTPGGGGALTIRSTLDGVVSQVLVPNGEQVEAGAPLVRLGGTQHLWLRSRFVAKPAIDLHGAQPRSARLPDGQVIDLDQLGARFLSALPVVDPTSRIATWLVDVVAAQRETTNGAAGALRVGMNVVLGVRFGEPETLLAVPRGAVVEINTRPFVFVQLDGEHFEKRAVTLGQVDGPWVAIVSGVQKGERVVSRGGFDIHLAALMGTIESHRH